MVLCQPWQLSSDEELHVDQQLTAIQPFSLPHRLQVTHIPLSLSKDFPLPLSSSHFLLPGPAKEPGEMRAIATAYKYYILPQPKSISQVVMTTVDSYRFPVTLTLGMH